MTRNIERIRTRIAPLCKQIVEHKVYSEINKIEDIRIFMQYHIYAVWDFMSLLKSLQNNLTCTTVPWFPKGDAETRYLINEIVTGEESDVDASGNRKSHFELYLGAMEQCGADILQINIFLKTMMATRDLDGALAASRTPKAAADFVRSTFGVINSDKAYLQAAIFTFGREDLIPGMFMSIINDLHNEAPEQISIFKYYLERHIEVDGGHHSHLALKMVGNLCGNSTQMWAKAEEAIVESLQRRIGLWDGVYAAILEKRNLSK